MDDQTQAAAYAGADFDEPNRQFVEELASRVPDAAGCTRVVDLGCGPALIPLDLLGRYPAMHIDGVDGAVAMIAQANAAAKDTVGADRLRLIHGEIPGVELPEKDYELVLSNSLLHHFADPSAFWQEVKRLVKPGGSVFIADLRRPPSRGDVAALVDRYGADEPEILRHDLYRSLCAAFTPQEVRLQLAQAGLSLSVQSLGDRHLMVFGRVS